MHDTTIADFATHLVPEAFARRHSADRVELVSDVPSGADAFADWITARLAEAVVDRYPAGGVPVRFIVAEGGDGVRWRWDESVCCPPRWFADRVNEEVEDVPTPWVFAVELERPEARFGTAVSFGSRAVPGGHRPGDPRWEATWYAEGRGRGVASVCAGVVELEELPGGRGDRILAQREAHHRDLSVAPYHRILRGHPARARHHLRRRG